jgi:hypothetical protein
MTINFTQSIVVKDLSILYYVRDAGLVGDLSFLSYYFTVKSTGIIKCTVF